MPSQILHLAPKYTFGQLQPIDRMVKHAAAYLGGDDDPEARAKALEFMDRAADRMNDFGLFLFARRIAEYSISAATLSDGDSTVDFPTDFGWPYEPNFVDDSSGNRVGDMEWVPWETFQYSIKGPGFSVSPGAPSFLSFLNELPSSGDYSATDGKIHFYPAAASSAIDKITIAYIARLPRPSEVTDPEEVRILPEAREVLLTGTIALLQQFRRQGQPAIWDRYMKDFEKWLDRARASAARQQGVFHTLITPQEAGLSGRHSPPRQTYLVL